VEEVYNEFVARAIMFGWIAGRAFGFPSGRSFALRSNNLLRALPVKTNYAYAIPTCLGKKLIVISNIAHYFSVLIFQVGANLQRKLFAFHHGRVIGSEILDGAVV
jgi:hypothetical protein